MRIATSVMQAANPRSAHVQEVIVAAEHELHQLLQQRSEIMKRIGTVKQTIAGLANVFGEDLLSDELLALIDAHLHPRT